MKKKREYSVTMNQYNYDKFLINSNIKNILIIQMASGSFENEDPLFLLRFTPDKL